jgi:hypothetical protein
VKRAPVNFNTKVSPLLEDDLSQSNHKFFNRNTPKKTEKK